MATAVGTAFTVTKSRSTIAESKSPLSRGSFPGPSAKGRASCRRSTTRCSPPTISGSTSRSIGTDCRRAFASPVGASRPRANQSKPFAHGSEGASSLGITGFSVPMSPRRTSMPRDIQERVCDRCACAAWPSAACDRSAACRRDLGGGFPKKHQRAGSQFPRYVRKSALENRRLRYLDKTLRQPSRSSRPARDQGTRRSLRDKAPDLNCHAGLQSLRRSSAGSDRVGSRPALSALGTLPRR